jgi:CubicO group peptidase (beta-lactamase class C family)
MTTTTDAAALGVEIEALDALLHRARREIDSGLLPSCQLALARDGELAAFVALGDATLDTRYVIFSCTKAVVSSAVWILIQEGALDPAQKVADLIPEFGTNGKDVITVEEVMLHTSGFPHAPLGPPQWHSREQRLQRFSEWRLNWEPGTTWEYHATSGLWIQAELIERLAGEDYRDFVRTRVLDPHGLEKLRVGVPPAEQGDIAEVVHVGEPATPEELEAALGVRSMPVTEVTDEAVLRFNEPDVLALGVPGGGGVSTAADLALFYQALLHNRAGVWDPDVLADATGTVRNNLGDRNFGRPASRSLGLVIAGDDGQSHIRGLGRTVSPRAFGHNGAGGQIAWADPATGISFVYLTNGHDAHQIRQGRRGVALSSLAAVCAPR